MKKRTPKSKDKYPRLSLRVDKPLLARIEAVRARTGMKYSGIVTASLRQHLPELEKLYGVAK